MSLSPLIELQQPAPTPTVPIDSTVSIAGTQKISILPAMGRRAGDTRGANPQPSEMSRLAFELWIDLRSPGFGLSPFDLLK